MHSVEDAIPESFAFVGAAQAAAEVEHCVVIIQRQYSFYLYPSQMEEIKNLVDQANAKSQSEFLCFSWS